MAAKYKSGVKRIDRGTFGVYLALVILGWLMIYSVGYGESSSFFHSSAGKQAIWIGISFVAFAVINLIDWKFWRTFAYLAYIFGLLLLIAVLLFGMTIKGATSWFAFGGVSIQPSEFAKFATCLAMASFLSAPNTDLREIKYQAGAFALFLLPAGLILAQPDAGSALVFFSFLILLFREGLSPSYYIVGIFGITIFLTGLVFGPQYITLGLLLLSLLVLAFNTNGQKKYWVSGTLAAAAGAVFLAWQGHLQWVLIGSGAAFLLFSLFMIQKKRGRVVSLLLLAISSGWAIAYVSNYIFNNVLKPHQQDRLNVWLQPSKCDPRGSLYNVLQSKMAIGSGGLNGKGIFQGTLTKLNYVPEQSTDFIFCTIGEEHGFIGTLGIVGLFFLLIYRITVIAERQRSSFSRHFAYGVAGIIFIHFFINIGMTMGLMPIIGIPLPFLSKGGSSLLGFTVMIAVLLKLDRNRYQI